MMGIQAELEVATVYQTFLASLDGIPKQPREEICAATRLTGF